MSEKKSPPHKEKANVSKSTINDAKSNKRKFGPGSPSEDEDKKNQQKRKRPNIVDGASPEHIGMGSPRGAGTVSRLSVPLSERQQMAILMKMADESTVGDTSPKSPSSGNQVTSTTKRTPADKKVNKRNERGEAPLHMAAKRGDYRQTKYLLKAGASVNMEDYAGWTALHEACNLGNIRVARYLLKAGADVNVQGFDDDTPLHDASSNGHRKLVQLLLRHGADPHQANLKGKTAIDVAANSQVEAILRGSSTNYSSDSESNSEMSSCDSIISTKEEDRNLDEELRLHGAQSKVDLIGSSSAVTAVRRQSVPASPDKSASSPRLFMKLQHKKSSSSSSSTNEEQQRVSEWNVLTMETGGCDVMSDTDSNSRPLEPRSSTTSGSSRLSSKQEDGWNLRLPQAALGRSNRGGVDSDGFPDSTMSSSTPVVFPTVPLQRTATEPFTPTNMLPSLGDGDSVEEHGDVFANSNNNSSSSSCVVNTKSNTSTSKSFNVIPVCSNSSTSSSSVNKQLSPQPPQHHSLIHLHQHNSPVRPSIHPSHPHHKSIAPPSVQSVAGSSVYPRDQFKIHQGHSQPTFTNSAHVSKESVSVSSSSSSPSPLPLTHHRSQVSIHHSTNVIPPATISSISSSLHLSTVSTVAGIPSLYQHPTTAVAISSSLPASSNSSQSNNSTTKTTFTTNSSRPSPHQLPFTPFSARAPKAGGSIVTGLSDRALAASNSATTPSSLTPALSVSISASATATNPLSSPSLNSLARQRDSSSPRIPLPQRVEDLSNTSHPKSDTSSCDSPLCMDMDDFNNTPSEHGSRPSTPKVPPLKIIMPGKVVVPSADDFSKPPNKPALPYVLNPTQEGGAEGGEGTDEGLTANPTSEAEGGENTASLPSVSPGPINANKGEGGGGSNSAEALTDKEGNDGQQNWEAEDSRESRESDARNEQGDSGSNDKSDDGSKEKRSTRTLRSHTAMMQQQGKSTERNGNITNDKNSVIEQKDEGDNNSTTRSQKGDDSVADDSSFPPRKRKLRNKNEVQPAPAPVTNPTTLAPKLPQPMEKPPNPYETYLNLRRQIANRHRSLCNVPPKPPSGFKDYLMVNCTYVLQGNATSTLSVPMLPPPNLVKEPMREFFIQQEKARYRLRLQHVIEREKLMLSIEQEILREHGRAARAIANQTLPFSVCTILREEEIYNQQELEQDESRDKNVRSRYNGRQFLSWLQDVDDKYDKIKSLLLLRHHHEAESLYAVQKLDWEWKMKEFGLCDNKNTPIIDDLHVPMVAVSDEFDLLPSS